MPVSELSSLYTIEASRIHTTGVGDFADCLRETAPYFEAWLESLKPSPRPIDKPLPASEFNFEGTLRIDCRVSGVLYSQTGTLFVGETAEVQADIFVATAIIDGELRGNIRATERVELDSHARVIGNIETPSLSIQPGALFDGQCHFLHSARKSENENTARSSAEDSAQPTHASRQTPASSERDKEMTASAAGR